jgi:hypothetical protein
MFVQPTTMRGSTAKRWSSLERKVTTIFQWSPNLRTEVCGSTQRFFDEQ